MWRLLLAYSAIIFSAFVRSAAYEDLYPGYGGGGYEFGGDSDEERDDGKVILALAWGQGRRWRCVDGGTDAGCAPAMVACLRFRVPVCTGGWWLASTRSGGTGKVHASVGRSRCF